MKSLIIKEAEIGLKIVKKEALPQVEETVQEETNEEETKDKKEPTWQANYDLEYREDVPEYIAKQVKKKFTTDDFFRMEEDKTI